MSATVDVTAAGVVTGWGAGVAALPDDAVAAARGRQVIGLPRPERDGDRFRRATRECLLGVAAVEAMLAERGLGREGIGGPDTALVYVTASAYGASNVAFIEAAGAAAGAGALHFPYTAPSAVPAEVAIEFGLRGPYVILIGAAHAARDAVWQAERLIRRGACARAVVLAVETFEECAALYARARWLVGRPLVEAAVAVLFEAVPAPGRGAGAAPDDDALRRRVGETRACGPLIALALAHRAAAPR